MKNCDIIHALAQKLIDSIYGEWYHEGHIESEESDNFWFTIDGRLYKVKLENRGRADAEEEAPHD